MDNEKKPSIYDDRGTIGSSEELDKYGVWVKSEPQDLTSASQEIKETPAKTVAAAVSASSSAADDLDVPDMGELPDFDSLQSDFTEDSTAEIQNDFEIPEIEIEEKSDVEIFDFGEMAEIEESAETEEVKQGDNEGFTEVSMDDFIDTLDTESSVPEAVEVTEEEPAASSYMETSESRSNDLSTQLLMKIAEELASIRTELSSLKKEFSGIKAAAAAQEEPEEKGFFGEEDDEKIALTGDELNNILNTADFTEESGSDATVDLSQDLIIEEAEDIVSSDPFLEPAAEIIEGTAETAAAELPSIPGDLDLDISLEDTNLEELESEPSTSLEDEVSEVSSLDDSPEIDPEIDIEEFETEEIETIGPELSADNAFGDDESFEISLDDGSFPMEDESESGQETMPAGVSESSEELSSDELSSDELSSDELSSDLISDAEELPDFAIEETDELKELRENGAEPMTDAPDPEDADYLEMDPLAGAPLAEEEAIDLSEAVIDEPDLSGDIQDNPLEEPSLEDISINFDTSELETEDIPAEESIEEQEAEAAFSIDEDLAELGSGEDLSLIPEGFLVEAEDAQTPLEEIEDDVIPAEDLDILGTEPDSVDEIQDFEAAEADIPVNLQQELKTVLSYLDQLLESLPDEKIEEFAKSDYYDTYKKLFRELGLV